MRSLLPVLLLAAPLSAAFSPGKHRAAKLISRTPTPLQVFANDAEASTNGSNQSLTAREARIMAPMSAIAAVMFGSLPSDKAMALDEETFEAACRQYFPASLPSSKVASRAVLALRNRGYNVDNTLLATSLCSDEVNDTPLSLFGQLQSGLVKGKSGGVFNLGGLGGIPFVGPSGFGAFFSHSPASGKVVIVYGPHVGISSDGVVGKVERIGMKKKSGACGAALGAYKAIKAERAKGVPVEGVLGGSPYGSTMRDVQEDYIIRELRTRLEKEPLDNPDENANVALVTEKMYDMVSSLLVSEVDSAITKPGFFDTISEVSLLGGIVINRGNKEGVGDLEDYFRPYTFKTLRREPSLSAIVADNLLGSLYDEDSFVTKLQTTKFSNDAVIGGALASAAIAAGVVAFSPISPGGDSETTILETPPVRAIGADKEPKQLNGSRNILPRAKQTAINDLLETAIACDRGQDASPNQRMAAASVINELEGMSPVSNPAIAPKIEGTWNLVYSDALVLRTTPLFMTRRASIRSNRDLGRYETNCDRIENALRNFDVGKVRQIVGGNRLVSEVELNLGTLQSAFVSTANLEPELEGKAWKVTLDRNEVLGANVPFVRQVLDLNLGANKFAQNILGVDKSALFVTTYLDDSLRISRDEDDYVYVFEKVSDSTEPTVYSTVATDFGLSKLVS